MMKQVRENQDAVDLSRHVLRRAMDRNAFVAGLRDSLERLIPAELRTDYPDPKRRRRKRITFNDHMVAIRRFGEFLDDNGIDSVMPDEQMLADFIVWLERNRLGGKGRFRSAMAGFVKRLVNMLPPEILNRPLVQAQRAAKARELAALSKETRRILDDFVEDGRKVKKGNGGKGLSRERLAPGYRKWLAGVARSFLKVVGTDDIQAATRDDAEAFIDDYAKRGKQQTGLNLLADLRSLFVNMQAKGLIEGNPLEEFTDKKVAVRDDYLPEAQAEKLTDLSTLDMRDFMAVRDRLMCLLAYDFCVRSGEIALLETRDLRSAGDYAELTLRPEGQKGQDKKRVTLLSCFAATRPVAETYLRLRGRLGPGTESLIVSRDGRAVKSGGCRAAVKRHCRGLAIRTHAGSQDVVPHLLRHTFGTLNIEPLGMGLSLSELQARLRHEDPRTTRRNYVTDNSVLARERHDARMNGGRNGAVASGRSVVARCVNVDFTVPELEAVRRLRALGITWRGLRDYCAAKGLVQKRGRSYFYSESLLDDLRQKWMTKDKARRVLSKGRSSLDYWIRAKGVETLTIGGATLLSNRDVLEAV